MSKVQNGATVVDRITGFKGTVTGICTYLSGCNQALVSPRASHDGKMNDAAWIDIQRLEVDEKVALVQLDNGPNPGCDKAPPVR